MATSIFITNDALSGHIGTAQVLPYLEGLTSTGHELDCISVEPHNSEWDDEGAWRLRLQAAGVRHHTVPRNSGQMYALDRFLVPLRLRRSLGTVISLNRPDLIHCRSYMPLSSVLWAYDRFKIPFVFDMRGFWIDQRIEGGGWDEGSLGWRQVIRYMRYLETRAISNAGGIVTLTEDARSIIMRRPDYRGAPVITIPCSVRGDVFRPLDSRSETRRRLGIRSDSYVIAYLGSFGGLYRMDVVYRLWRALLERGVDTVLLFIGDHNFSAHSSAAAKCGVTLTPERTFFAKASHAEVPVTLCAADVGISPIIQTFSSAGVSATKVGEYLSCGLPVVTNLGVGDARQIIADGANGFVLRDFEDDSICACASAIIAGKNGQFQSAAEISRRAQQHFGMEHALAAYNELYSRVSQGRWSC